MKKGIHPENYRLVAFKDMSYDDKTEFDSHNWLIYVLFYFCRPFFQPF